MAKTPPKRVATAAAPRQTNHKTRLESLGTPGTTVALSALVLAGVRVALVVWAVRQERHSSAVDGELTALSA